MRCPYCGQVNTDATRYCPRCGRAIGAVQQPLLSTRPPVVPPAVPPSPAVRGQRGRLPGPGVVEATAQPVAAAAAPLGEAVASPGPPEGFPPRTLAQLQELATATALTYTVGSNRLEAGNKKVVEIIYPPCPAWQQVATLYKALSEHDDERYDSMIIRGFCEESDLRFAFNNGRLTFDRRVRLGGQLIRRYLIETHRGFEVNSVRIVLTEEWPAEQLRS
ncbi:zinc ribbon domain-containing protein [Thermogemmatispora carboxidivorans]|uniref:zinc ribbon domain-containing protein n=1 Tax=Thermogemmatispora carboxidivorans TaxID=1382306 RepID=UPI00069A6247|nr:zinc ribbon domain-containing protein [Thermogemmatispora carboxidivorans]